MARILNFKLEKNQYFCQNLFIERLISKKISVYVRKTYQIYIQETR